MTYTPAAKGIGSEQACMAMIASHYGMTAPPSGGDNPDILEQIVAMAGVLGLDAQALEGEASALTEELPVPFLAHVSPPGSDGSIGRFVVVASLENNGVELWDTDPLLGIHTLSVEDFAVLWTGIAVFFEQRNGYRPSHKSLADHIAAGRASPAPVVLQIQLTARCPLRCPQCYCDLETGEQLPLDRVLSVLEEAASMGTGTIEFSGGEPLVFPGLEEAVSRAADLGMEAVLATSGWGCTPERLASLERAGLKTVFVSLNGSSSEIHALSRDRFDLGLAALENLSKTTLDTVINWVARADNIRDFPAMLKLARANGVSALVILKMKPDSFCELAGIPDREDTAFLAECIISHGKGLPRIGIERCHPALILAVSGSDTPLSDNGCDAGRKTMVVNALGEMQPCRHLPPDKTGVSLRDYWYGSPDLRALRLMEGKIGEPCRSCRHSESCRSCRAAGMKIHGDLYAGDETCHHAKT